ncbi:MAG: hypothetical protein ABIN18_20075, partial [Pseudomonadota bacterium]
TGTGETNSKLECSNAKNDRIPRLLFRALENFIFGFVSPVPVTSRGISYFDLPAHASLSKML